MNMAGTFDAVLVAVLVMLAVGIVAARASFAAVTAFIVYGLMLGIAWVRLAAVDVALTEAAIGSGLTGALFLGAVARLRSSTVPAPCGMATRFVTGVFCIAVSATLAVVVLRAPEGPVTLAPLAVAHLPESGLGNPVAGVLFVYRAFDTLLEKVVVVLALLGVWSLAPDRAWGGVPGLRVVGRNFGALRFLAQLLPPIGILVGIYMCWTGADYPGGAFQGGAVLAAMWILLMTVGLQKLPSTGSRPLRLLMMIGPAVFLVIGLSGFAMASAFLAYPEGYAKPLIIVVEFTLTLSIAVTLGLIAAGPPQQMQQK